MSNVISHWDYRICLIEGTYGGPDATFEVREVYYGPDDAVVGWSSEGSVAQGDCITGCLTDLRLMAMAADRAVVDLVREQARLDAMRP